MQEIRWIRSGFCFIECSQKPIIYRLLVTDFLCSLLKINWRVVLTFIDTCLNKPFKTFLLSVFHRNKKTRWTRFLYSSLLKFLGRQWAESRLMLTIVYMYSNVNHVPANANLMAKKFLEFTRPLLRFKTNNFSDYSFQDQTSNLTQKLKLNAIWT